MSTRRFGRYVVETTNEDRVLFPDSGITKGDLMDYYEAVGGVLIRYLRDRPLSMHRFPEGIGEAGFYQQKSESYFPDWIETITLAKEGGEITHPLCNRTATLVYLAQLGTITPHVWLSRVDELQLPDQIVIDLDPPDSDSFEDVRRGAFIVRAALEDLGLKTFVMTTGSSGVHVRAPVRREHPFDDMRAYLSEIMDGLAAEHADLLTTKQRKKERRGRIYLDVGRIAYGQTAVPPYAVRARPGAPVAAPLAWEELEVGSINARSFNILNMPDRLSDRGDPWSDMFRYSRSLNVS